MSLGARGLHSVKRQRVHRRLTQTPYSSRPKIGTGPSQNGTAQKRL